METTTRILMLIACSTILFILMFGCLFYYLYLKKLAKAKGQKTGVFSVTLLGLTIGLAVAAVFALVIAYVVNKRETPAFRRRQWLQRQDRIYEIRTRTLERRLGNMYISMLKIERALEVIAEEEEDHVV